MRMPSAFVSLLALGAVACEDPATPPQRTAQCEDVHNNRETISAHAMRTSEIGNQFSQQSREAIEAAGYTLENAFENVYLLRNRDGDLIELGAAGVAVTLPKGDVVAYPYVQYLALDAGNALVSRDDSGRPTYGLVAAPLEPQAYISHPAFDGVTSTPVTLEVSNLSAEVLPLVPQSLRNLGDYSLPTNGGNEPLLLSELREDSISEISVLGRQAQRLRDTLDSLERDYPTSARWCREQDEAIADHARRYPPKGAAVVDRAPQ